MKKHRKLKIFCLVVVFALLPVTIFAQLTGGRSYIREQIQRWGSCRLVAITRTNGNLAVYGRNGWAGTGIPLSMERELNRLNSNNEFIRDVVLTEQGRWLILYGNNGLLWDGIPDNDPLLSALREYNAMSEIITSVAFNDYGEWVIITENYFLASNADLQSWLREGHALMGVIWTVSISEDAMVAVHDDGFRYLGNVPQDLRNALRDTNVNVYFVKLAGTAWFFADFDGRYEYNM